MCYQVSEVGAVRGKGGGFKPTPVAERLWRKTDRTAGPDACWEWRGFQLPNGYGRIGVGSMRDGTRRVALTHRVSWEVANGTIPDGMQVCHRCDNPPCVNPAHLFLGTGKDNMDDAVAKGRFPTGEDHWTNRLEAKRGPDGVFIPRTDDGIPDGSCTTRSARP